MRLIAYVHSGAEMAPSYALIEIEDVENLKRRLAEVAAFAEKFGHDGNRRAEGEVFSVLFWANSIPISVTWLLYDAITDAEGDEPEWLGDLAVPPDDWEPKLEDEDGGSNVFFEADLVKLEVYPDGTMDVQANLWGGPDVMDTQEFSLQSFEV